MTRAFLFLGLLLALSASIALYRINASIESLSRVQRLLDEIAAVDSEIYYHLVLLHAGVVKNFDALVTLERAHRSLVGNLSLTLKQIDERTFTGDLVDIGSIAQDKSEQLERFKSDTAILNNAKIYIGEKISTVSNSLHTSTTLLKLSTALVVFAEAPSQALAQNVRQLAHELESQDMPPAARLEWNKGKRHLDDYLDKKLSLMSAQPLTLNWSQLAQFNRLKTELNFLAQNKRRTFELALLALAMGFVIIAIVAFNSLNRYLRARRELIALNNSLEEKINAAVFEIKQSRDEAVKANAAKTSFLANLSHEVRTPLNSIIGFSARLEKKISSDDVSTLRAVKSIQANGVQLMNFFKDLLELSRFIIDKPQNAIDLGRSVDLAKVCRERAVELEAFMERKSLGIEISSHGNCHLLAGASQIQRAINGALSTMIILSSGNTIHCDISGGDDACQVVFQAYGETLSSSRIKRILDPFSPEDDLSTRVENVGLGLSLTKKILDSLGGELGFLSKDGINEISIQIPRQQPTRNITVSDESVKNKTSS